MPTFGGMIFGTGVEASGRRTFSDVIDELARPVDASDTDLRALCADSFRAAVRTMNRKGCWPWELLDEEITIDGTQAQGLYTVSGPVKKNLAMHYLSASGGIPNERIWYEKYEKLVECWNLNINGRATYYSIPNFFETAQVRFYPVPTGLDYARFSYYRVTPEPRAEDEPLEIPDWATEVYTAFAWVEICKRSASHRSVMTLPAAMAGAMSAFRELSAFVVQPGDRVRDAS